MVCLQCKPWPDGGCDFSCPCSDCDEGRRYEAFVTNPHRDTPLAPECAAYLAWLRGDRAEPFRFDDGDDEEGRDGCDAVDEYAERGLVRSDFY
jgi:hypothetical protein